MSVATKTYDVFISHSAIDLATARTVADSLEATGLATFHLGLQVSDRTISEEVWEALAECRAVIAIVSSSIQTNANVLLEIGAASAWNKPIFLLFKEFATKVPMGALQEYPSYPLSRLDDVIGAIKSGFQPLTDPERQVLRELYQEIGISADELAQSPSSLRELTLDFNQQTHKTYSGERLLSELLRLRKSGKLPRVSSVRKEPR